MGHLLTSLGLEIESGVNAKTDQITDTVCQIYSLCEVS